MRVIIRTNRPEPFKFFDVFPIAVYWRNVKKSTGDKLLDEALDIFSNQRNWIVKIALKYLNKNIADAEDVAEDLVLELFENKELRKRFIEECKVKISKYFHSVIKFKAIDLYQKNLVSLDLLLEKKSIELVEGKDKNNIVYVDVKDLKQPSDNPYRQMHTEEVINLVNELKVHLTGNSLEIVDLKMRGLSVEQICWLLNTSRATYFRHWNKAKKEIKSLLKKRGYVKTELLEGDRQCAKIVKKA